MRFIQLLTPCFVLLAAATAGHGFQSVESRNRNEARPIMGFAPSRMEAQQVREAQFAGYLSSADQKAWLERLAAHPHHLGSEYDHANAEWIAEQFRSWGFDTQIQEYRVLFPTPRTRLLEMIEPERFVATLVEPVLEEDSTSGQTDEQLPSYNAYSIDGDVTGELVYVNYGAPDDYDELERQGIDVAGKIVIARYGGSFRGTKPKVAAQKGAIGCIIYSDPHDDGYFAGDVYPKGSYRMEQGVQRGSVLDVPVFPGDPLTPNVGAKADARRLDRAEAPTLTKIPVLPISYADAKPLLEALEGPVAPWWWCGALPFTYHLGPGPAKVHLKLEFNWDIVPSYDVIARLEGLERPDELIIRGNHHDAWVNGAGDPISGMVALMNEARAVGKLAQDGWRPKRTIVYCGWDSEEQGLMGSVEWVEDHSDMLRRQAAVYINTDSNGRGFLSMGGSHTLEKFINGVARDVTDPQTGVSVWKRLQASELIAGSDKSKREARDRGYLHIGALGSGSDYTPFLQHLGVASLNLGFGGEDGGGSYHSIFDSIDHFERFGDPGLKYGVALAEVCGRATLRLADADVLPFEFKTLAETIGEYRDGVIELADRMRKETEIENRLIKDGTYALAADPTKKYAPPDPEDAVPHFNFAPLQNAIDALKKAADSYAEAVGARLAAGDTLPVDLARNLDRALYRTERALTRDEGLPARPWYKHYIYAPGLYTGYGAKTLPAVRETIEGREFGAVDARIEHTARAIRAAAEQIEKATALIK